MNARIDNMAPVLDDVPGAMEAGQWHARLSLEFTRSNASTRLARKSHSGPLYVQKPFYPEGRDFAHVYLLHPPGGLVSGDRLEIEVSLHEGARAQLTTPGAGRVYRAREAGTGQQQTNRLFAAENAMLEWFPQECIVFNNADARLQTEVHLAPSATYSGWELVSLGLPASQHEFTAGVVKQQLIIHIDERPVLVETLMIDEEAQALLNAITGLQGSPVSGVYAAGPFRDEAASDALLEQLRALAGEYRPLDTIRSRCLTGVTCLNGFIICRYLGSCTWQARHFFAAAWSRIRPVLNQRPACAPRIWST